MYNDDWGENYNKLPQQRSYPFHTGTCNSKAQITALG